MIHVRLVHVAIDHLRLGKGCDDMMLTRDAESSPEEYPAKKMDKEASVGGSQGDHEVGETELITFTPEEERRVVRKIDCVVLPLVSLTPYSALELSTGRDLEAIVCT